ncbi:hypothetical protein D1007_44770 [Hordeum vulgare]|nr:hypothetical protein D1007_44770 [Hordeum vulgare]
MILHAPVIYVALPCYKADGSNAESGGHRGTTGTPDGSTSQTLVSRTSAAQAAAETLPSSSSTAQAAAQTLPSSSVVASDTKTKALPAREPGSTHKLCRCDKSKCENKHCVCVKTGLPCCDRCECKDCDNNKTSEEKRQDLRIKREVPASGSGTSKITLSLLFIYASLP